MSERHRLPRFVRWSLALALAHPASPGKDPARRRACIYKVDRIGDFVLATGAIRTLIEHFGAEEVRLIVSDTAAPFARLEFPGLDCWTAPANATGVWRGLRPLRNELAPTWGREQFEIGVNLRHAASLYRDLSLTWIRARRWYAIGAFPRIGRVALNHRPAPSRSYPVTTLPTSRPWCRELLAHRAVLSSILRREPSWDEIRPQLTSAQPKSGSHILLCPFGSDPIRDYPAEAWAAALSQSIPVGRMVTVLGQPDRSQALQDLGNRLRGQNISVEILTNSSPTEFLRLIATARLVCTVESAAAHIATALDKPAVILVGGGHFGWFAPWGQSSRQHWLHEPLDCYDCEWQCRRATVDCMGQLASNRVAAAVKNALADA